MLTCNFEEVILKCSPKRDNAIVGALAVLAVLVVLYLCMGSMAALLLGGVSSITIILYTVYGYSPACIPLIPHCVVQDALYMLRTLLPLQLQLPSALEYIQGCSSNANISAESCFVPCSELNYTGWEASAAWAACDLIDPHWCIDTFAPWADSFLSTPMLGRLAREKGGLCVQAADASLIAANRVCFVVTMANVLPYLLIFLGGIYASILASRIPLTLAQVALDVGVQALAHTHMQALMRRRQTGSEE